MAVAVAVAVLKSEICKSVVRLLLLVCVCEAPSLIDVIRLTIYIAFTTEWPFLVNSLSSVHFVISFVSCVVVTQYKTVSQTEKPTQAYTT